MATITIISNSLKSSIVIYLTCLLCLLSSHHHSLQTLASSIAIQSTLSNSNSADNGKTVSNNIAQQQQQLPVENPSDTQIGNHQHNHDHSEYPIAYHALTSEQQDELADHIKNMSESVWPHQPRNSMLLLIDLDKAKDASQSNKDSHHNHYSEQQARIIKGWGMGKGFIG